jgi:hypothetical protein
MLLSVQKKTAVSLRDGLAHAAVVTPQLISAVLEKAGLGLSTCREATDVHRLRSLIEAKAWTDVALAVIEKALPRWRLTRLVFDDGEWFCSISKNWQLPHWLDGDMVEARHEIMPLAILGAIVEALETSRIAEQRRLVTMPICGRNAHSSAHVICCDNFA